ncbi:proton-coupled amino acid transporter-like protein pathetic isoform X3 [Amyelois transitella]|uniref:proton-coupled amino acid transporter-like protein pathetic isoform X3 n=1 Tax=Amyelois transitella TaxID=680683 RepID=UPI00298F5406|nr:proton-coupled amino acid transporter-like protein pathetic isoform X3 [Amyelois transitella]
MTSSEKKEVEANEYNPFEHRQVEKPNSDIRTLANLVKASLGSGLLAIPLAFSNSGWGLGLIGTAVIALVCTHSAHIFVEISQACCRAERKPILSYSETCEAAFSNGPKSARRIAGAARIFAEFALLCTYLGVACIFTVLIADSVKQLLDTYAPAYIMRVEYYCLILLIPLCVLVQIRHLKFLAPLSLVANILLIITFAICLYYIFKDGFTVADKKVVGNPARFPAFLSTVIFAMEGIGVVMPIANQMKNPQRFLGCPGVLSIAMTLVAVLYGSLGVLGYFKYGDVLRGSITLNLPIDDWPAICAKCFIAVSIFLTYPLHYFVVIDLLTKYLQPRVKENYRSIFQVVLRALIVCFCAGVGVALPFLEQIINIVGSLFYSLLGLIIPAIIHSVFHYQNLGKWNWILWKNSLIVIFGSICLVSGCAVTIFDIIDKLNAKTE